MIGFHRFHGAFLAQAGVFRRDGVFRVQELVPVTQDGFAQDRLDERFEPGAGGDVTAVLAREVVAVARELVHLGGGGDLRVVVQPRASGDLHGFAGRDDHGNVELLRGALHAIFDGLVHLDLVPAVAGEGPVVGIGGIGPGHVPDDGRPGVGRFLPDDGDELRNALLVRFVEARIVRGLLDRDDVPGLVLQAVQDRRVPADGHPFVLGGLVIDVVRRPLGILLTMPFQGAAADVQARDDDVVDARGLEQAGEILSPVVGKAVAHGEDPEGVRMLRQGVIVDADLGVKARGRHEGDQGQEDSFQRHKQWITIQRYGKKYYLCVQ